MKNKNDDLKIIDNHCHFNFLEPIEDTVRGFKAEAKELGLSGLAVLSCPRTGKRESGSGPDLLENLKGLYLKERMRIPVYAYAGFTWHYDDSASYVEFAKSMLEMGADGFKALEQHPGVRKQVGKGLCDTSFDDFFDYIGKKGVPMVCHVGDPRFNWCKGTASEAAKKLGRVYDDTFLSLDELYGEMEEVLRKHPNVKIILAHFYFKSDDYEGLVSLMERYPNVYLDLTPGAEMFVGFSKDIEKWRGFFLRYSKRIILGSDLYGAGYGVSRHKLVRRYLETSEPFVEEESQETVIPMHLPREVLKDIYAENAIRISSPEPKPVNREKAYASCCDIADNHWDKLNEIERQNLKTFMEFWKR